MTAGAVGALVERMEAATKGSRELDYAIGGGVAFGSQVPNYTTSVDAALTLVPEGMDWGVSWSRLHKLETWVKAPMRRGTTCHQGYAPDGDDTARNAALALCIAALRARQEKT